jgi:hypothetical protein
MVMINYVFWDITSNRAVKVNTGFRGTTRLHPQGKTSKSRKTWAWCRQQPGWTSSFHVQKQLMLDWGSFFRDKTVCNTLRANRPFLGKASPSRCIALALLTAWLMLVYCLIHSSILTTNATYSSETSVDFHDVTSQKTTLYIKKNTVLHNIHSVRSVLY